MSTEYLATIDDERVVPTRTHIMRRRADSAGLAEVVDLILDKGLVIDAFVRVSVLGLELLTIEAHILISSVDTYLQYADAVDRVPIDKRGKGFSEMAGDTTRGVASGKVGGAVEGALGAVGEKVRGVGDKVRDKVAGDEDDQDQASGQ